MEHKYKDNSEKIKSHHDLENASLLALVLNLLFVFIEIGGGLLTNSVAIMSDAIHDFGDVITLLISYILIKVSKKERTQNYTFGFQSLVVIGALLNTLILLSSSIFILTNSLIRLSNPEDVRGGIMFFIAIAAVLVNGISVLRLSKQSNVMSKSLMFHLLEDVLGWLGVLISSIFIYFFNLNFLDTILSIIICLVIFFGAFRNLKEIIKILTYKVPKDTSVKKIEEEVLEVNEIKEVLDIRVWTIDGETNCICMTALVKEEYSFDKLMEVKKEIELVLEQFNVSYTNIEFSAK